MTEKLNSGHNQRMIIRMLQAQPLPYAAIISETRNKSNIIRCLAGLEKRGVILISDGMVSLNPAPAKQKRQAGFTKWTAEMNEYLRQHYELNGNKKLAAMFEQHFPKQFRWTLKHIEKRMMYMGLRRTSEQVSDIRRANNGDGRHYKMWDTRGRMEEGDIRWWEGRAYIKVNGRVITYNRHVAKPPAGSVSRVVEGQLKVITRKENAYLNSQIRKAKSPEVKRTIHLINQLTRKINEKQTHRP